MVRSRTSCPHSATSPQRRVPTAWARRLPGRGGWHSAALGLGRLLPRDEASRLPRAAGGAQGGSGAATTSRAPQHPAGCANAALARGRGRGRWWPGSCRGPPSSLGAGGGPMPVMPVAALSPSPPGPIGAGGPEGPSPQQSPAGKGEGAGGRARRTKKASINYSSSEVKGRKHNTRQRALAGPGRGGARGGQEGLQGLGRPGAGVHRWRRLPPRAPRGPGIPGGRAPLEGPGSAALPPWKRLGSANPWQHTPPHGNPPLVATRAPQPPPRATARSGGPGASAPQCAGPWRGAPSAAAATEGSGRLTERCASRCAPACGWQHPAGTTPGAGGRARPPQAAPRGVLLSAAGDGACGGDGWGTLPAGRLRCQEARPGRGLSAERGHEAALATPVPRPPAAPTPCPSRRRTAGFCFRAEGPEQSPPPPPAAGSRQPRAPAAVASVPGAGGHRGPASRVCLAGQGTRSTRPG